MESTLRDILKLAVFAPSGDNVQPWQFKLGEDWIEVINTGSGLDMYDFKKHGSFIGHGALIENISRIASSRGLKADTHLFPDPNNANLIARIVISPGETDAFSETEYIQKRVTDRKAFLTKPIDPRILDDMTQMMKAYDIEFSYVNEKKRLRKLLNLLSIGDEFAISNKELHDYLYSNICWSDQELIKRESGMHVDAIASSKLEAIALKLLKNWTLTNFLRKLGLGYFTVIKRRPIYRQTALIAYLVIKKESPEAYIETGRAMQALWLHATANGISVQPLSSILFLYSRLKHHNNENLSTRESNLIKKVGTAIYDMLEVKDGIITFCIRMGYTKYPHAINDRIRKAPIILNS